MTLEPCPQVLDGVEIGAVRWQEGHLDMPVEGIEVLADQRGAMRSGAIPDDQQRLLEVRFERLEKLDHLFFLDAAFVQPKQVVRPTEPGNRRHMIPVEMKLDDRRLPFQRPGADPGGAFADTGFVDENYQSAFSPGFF